MDAESVAHVITLLRGQGRVHLDKSDPHARLFPSDEIGEDARLAFCGRLTSTDQFEAHGPCQVE